jgi:chromate transport protein ChrA
MGAGVGYGARSALSVLGMIIALIGSIVAAIIVLGIVLVLLKANPHNAIVKDIHDAAKALVGPFDGMFTIRHQRIQVAVNWGIAAAVWLVASRMIARLLSR